MCAQADGEASAEALVPLGETVCYRWYIPSQQGQSLRPSSGA